MYSGRCNVHLVFSNHDVYEGVLLYRFGLLEDRPPESRNIEGVELLNNLLDI